VTSALVGGSRVLTINQNFLYNIVRLRSLSPFRGFVPREKIPHDAYLISQINSTWRLYLCLLSSVVMPANFSCEHGEISTEGFGGCGFCRHVCLMPTKLGSAFGTKHKRTKSKGHNRTRIITPLVPKQEVQLSNVAVKSHTEFREKTDPLKEIVAENMSIYVVEDTSKKWVLRKSIIMYKIEPGFHNG